MFFADDGRVRKEPLDRFDESRGDSKVDRSEDLAINLIVSVHTPLGSGCLIPAGAYLFNEL